MVILAGLEAFLGPLGAILAPLGVILVGLEAFLAGKWPWLEREYNFQGAAGGAHRFKERAGSAQLERFGTPSPP